MQRVTFHLEKRQIAKLKHYAKSTAKEKAELVRDALDVYLTPQFMSLHEQWRDKRKKHVKEVLKKMAADKRRKDGNKRSIKVGVS